MLHISVTSMIYLFLSLFLPITSRFTFIKCYLELTFNTHVNLLCTNNVFLFYFAVAPLVTFISANETYERGKNVTLNCSAIGGPDIFYQWQANGTDISWEISTTLILSKVNASTGGEYNCIVSNSAGEDSASTFVFISPYFTTQPENRGGNNGFNVTLICEAEAFPAPQYQWAREDVAAIRDAVLGFNSTMLSFYPLMFGDEGNYFCNATSGSRSIQSSLVTLSGKYSYFVRCL